jgi:hypothetical protein
MSSKRRVSLWVCFGCAALYSQFLAGSAQQFPATTFSQTLEMKHFGFAVHYPANWSATQEGGVVWIVNAPQAQATGKALDQLAQIYVSVEKRSDHAAAVQRLRNVALEYDAPVTYLSIGGWPALRRQVVVEKAQAGEGEDTSSPQKALQVTTAIAAGDLLIREEAWVPLNMSQEVQEEVRSIQTGLSFTRPGNSAETNRELEELRASPKPAQLRPPPRRDDRAAAQQNVLTNKASAEALAGNITVPTSGAAQNIPGPNDEPEIAVSTDGTKVVIGAQFNYAISTDGGKTFPTQAAFPISTGGDASLAFGKSGTFYEGTISKRSSALNVLLPGSLAFTFLSNAFTCPTKGPNQCQFQGPALPDQEHVAADRFKASPSGLDQVYFVWRMGGAGTNRYGITCSQNSGATFGVTQFLQFFTGDFPRITVGQDGSVYVVYMVGQNVELVRFTSCQSGLSIANNFFPITVATGVNVNCPVPGLDRCNNGNTLASPMVAVDDQRESVVYVSYASATTPCGPTAAQQAQCNENILVNYSTNGGQSFQSSPLVANNPKVTARRFMPWICAAHGKAWISWYDRRAANAAGATDDLTAYFLTSAQPLGSPALTRGAEVPLSVTSDPQCNAGAPTGSPLSWPFGARAIADGASCSAQPQIVTLGNGAPKYGDYNGSACSSVGAGRVYNVWASATPPPGLPAPGQITLYTSVIDASACGDTGEPCCFNSSTCNGNLACTNNVCSCGFSGQACCQPGSTCSPGFSCDINSQCTCGGLLEPCCNGQQCGSNLVCSGKTFTCVQSCGGQGQACCGTTCSPFLTCVAGKCECGGQNQPCCIPGGTCSSGLACGNGTCVSQSSGCGECNQTATSCVAGCSHKPPAQQQNCQINCSNLECNCYQINMCGKKCAMQ